MRFFSLSPSPSPPFSSLPENGGVNLNAPMSLLNRQTCYSTVSSAKSTGSLSLSPPLKHPSREKESRKREKEREEVLFQKKVRQRA